MSRPGAHKVTQSDTPLHLTPKEFALLQTLLENIGTAVPRGRLVTRLYGWRVEAEGNPIEVYIHNLRKKLGKCVIKTIRGVGYRIE